MPWYLDLNLSQAPNFFTASTALGSVSTRYRQYKPLIDAEVREERCTGGLE